MNEVSSAVVDTDCFGTVHRGHGNSNVEDAVKTTWAARLNEIFPTCWSGDAKRVVPADGGPRFIEPNTERWLLARRGRVTASARAEKIGLCTNFNDVAGLAEEIRGELDHGYERKPNMQNAYMAWGHKYEREALFNISIDLGVDFTEPGLIFHRDLQGAACTPDAYMGDDITVQVKCPYYSRNHLKMVYEKSISRQYWYQVQFECWLSGRTKILFASYDPRQPLSTRIFKLWIQPHQETWRQFERGIEWLRRAIDGETTPVKLKDLDGIPNLF
jgi:hypothetical protein